MHSNHQLLASKECHRQGIERMSWLELELVEHAPAPAQQQQAQGHGDGGVRVRWCWWWNQTGFWFWAWWWWRLERRQPVCYCGDVCIDYREVLFCVCELYATSNSKQLCLLTPKREPEANTYLILRFCMQFLLVTKIYKEPQRERRRHTTNTSPLHLASLLWWFANNFSGGCVGLPFFEFEIQLPLPHTRPTSTLRAFQ